MKLTKLDFGKRKYLHSPDLRNWDDWMGEKENGLYLLTRRRLYEIPNALLIALPDVLAGYRGTDGSFNGRGYNAYLWASSQYDSTYAWSRYLYYSHAQVNRNYDDKAYGFSAILERKEQSNEVN